jgi:thioredoxin 1
LIATEISKLLILQFYAPWCDLSKKLAPVLDEVASELRGVVNVARVDVMDNRDIGTRFGILGFPTLVLFSQGHIYRFHGRRSVDEIVEFARGGFQIHEPEIVPQELGIFGELILVSRHAYKEATKDLLEGNYRTINVFCIALPVIFVFLLLLVIFVPFSTPNYVSQQSDYVSALRSENEGRSEIPISRRAKQPSSATDTSSRENPKNK